MKLLNIFEKAISYPLSAAIVALNSPFYYLVAPFRKSPLTEAEQKELLPSINWKRVSLRNVFFNYANMLHPLRHPFETTFLVVTSFYQAAKHPHPTAKEIYSRQYKQKMNNIAKHFALFDAMLKHAERTPPVVQTTAKDLGTVDKNENTVLRLR